MLDIISELTIRAICHARDLWKLALGLVNNCVYRARQTREIYHVLPYSVGFKAHNELQKTMNKTVLGKCSFISKKTLQIFEITIKLKSNLHVGPVDIFLNFWHCNIHTCPAFGNFRPQTTTCTASSRSQWSPWTSRCGHYSVNHQGCSFP